MFLTFLSSSCSSGSPPIKCCSRCSDAALAWGSLRLPTRSRPPCRTVSSGFWEAAAPSRVKTTLLLRAPNQPRLIYVWLRRGEEAERRDSKWRLGSAGRRGLPSISRVWRPWWCCCCRAHALSREGDGEPRKQRRRSSCRDFWICWGPTSRRILPHVLRFLVAPCHSDRCTTSLQHEEEATVTTPAIPVVVPPPLETVVISS
jgi:hypothetical protein